LAIYGSIALQRSYLNPRVGFATHPEPNR